MWTQFSRSGFFSAHLGRLLLPCFKHERTQPVIHSVCRLCSLWCALRARIQVEASGESLWRVLMRGRSAVTSCFCSSSSVLAVFSGLHRRALLAARGSLAARHVQTQLLLCPTAAVQFAKVNLMSYYRMLRVIKPQVLCVCGSGCGVNGHDYPNGARIPAGDPCQDCTCVVRHENNLCHV